LFVFIYSIDANLQRFFIKNILFLFLVNLVVKPVWILGIDRQVQITVGHEAYGQYAALLSFSALFQILLDFGLLNYNNRRVAQSPIVFGRLFPNILAAKGILSLVYWSFIMILGWIMLPQQSDLLLLSALGCMQIFNALTLFFRSNISAVHRFKSDSIMSIMDKLLLIIMVGTLLYSTAFKTSFNIAWFVYAQLIANAIAAILGYALCYRIAPIQWHHIHFRKILHVMRSSMPYALLIFCMAIYMRIDVFLLKKLHDNGNYEAGVFAAAYRLLDISNNVTGVLFAGMLLPIFSKLFTQKQPFKALVVLNINMLLPIAIIAVITSWIMGQDIMNLQLQDIATNYDGIVFKMLMMAYPAYCINYIISTLLTAHGNIKSLIVVAVIASVFNVISNFLLIPIYGAWIAALIHVITTMTVMIGNIIIYHKQFKLRWNGVQILGYILFTGLGILGIYIIHEQIKPILFQLIMVAIWTIALLFICRFISLEKLKSLTHKI
jgi:O-antigen/teichoic acid export membrane protein